MTREIGKRRPGRAAAGFPLVLAALLLWGAAGCSASAPTEPSAATGGASQDVLRADIDAMDFEYTERDRDASYDEAQATVLELGSGIVTGAGASYDEGDASFVIEREGTYLLRGEVSDTQVRVAVGDQQKVQLVLDDAVLSASDRPALFVEEADKVFVTLAEGSHNSVSGGQADGVDGALNGAIYSKADLTFNGNGALAVEGQGENCHAIASKDDLVITGGSYDLKAPGNGLHGKDCVKVCDGVFSIEVEGDGVKSSNDEDAARGFISIDGGAFTVKAGDDGFDAQHYFRVTDGVIGLDAADDGFHCESDGAVQGGSITLKAGDDAFHSEYVLTIEGGSVTVEDCAEGYEAQEVYVNGGTSVITAQDDAVNASAADDGSSDEAAKAHGGPSQGAAPGAQEGCILQVNGGELTVYAGGDGLDSNGSLEVNGGIVLVSGPATGADGALDYETEATVNGGTVLAVGPAAMACGFTGGTQGSALVDIQGEAGVPVALASADGTLLAEFTPTNAYQTAVVSSPSLAVGDTCTVFSGSSTVEATIAEASAGNGRGGFGGSGRGGRPDAGSEGAAPPDGGDWPNAGTDGGRGERPQDMPEPPDGEGRSGAPRPSEEMEDGTDGHSTRDASAGVRDGIALGGETLQA